MAKIIPLESFKEQRLEEIDILGIVARDLNQESRIDLVTLSLHGALQTSVFVYPSQIFRINDKSIKKINPNFDTPRYIHSRNFISMPYEMLNNSFLAHARPLIPHLTKKYNLHKPRLIEQIFEYDAENYLYEIIRAM